MLVWTACLFFVSRVSLLPGQDLVFPMMFFCLFYETLQLDIIPLYLHFTSHAFVLTFKVSPFFLLICLGWDWRYYTCIFLLGEWCSFDFSPFGAGWVGWKTCRDTWDVIIALRSNATFLQMLKHSKKHGISKRTRTLPYKVKPPSFMEGSNDCFLKTTRLYFVWGIFSKWKTVWFTSSRKSLRQNKVVDVWPGSSDLKTSWWQVDSLVWTLGQIRSTKSQPISSSGVFENWISTIKNRFKFCKCMYRCIFTNIYLCSNETDLKKTIHIIFKPIYFN